MREIEQLGDALREKDKAMEEKQAAWEATERQYREQLHEGTSLQRLQHQKELCGPRVMLNIADTCTATC